MSAKQIQQTKTPAPPVRNGLVITGPWGGRHG